MIRRGKLKLDEALLRLRDRDTGKPVMAHGGSVHWNAHRRRWVMIAVESGGTSFLGEVWYAEADTPLGLWAYAVKVVTHDRYSFYNPKQHPMFDQHGGRVIYFEGTYTHTFSGNSDQTPRYDYNQVMYQLDLADERLALPRPVYDVSDGEKPGPEKASFEKPGFLETPGFWDDLLKRRFVGTVRTAPAFFAFDRQAPGSVPVVAGEKGLRAGKSGEAGAVFHALPADIKSPPAAAKPLYEFVPDARGRRVYSTDAKWQRPGYRRTEKPLCLVW